MVEKSMEFARAGLPGFAAAPFEAPVVYGITALRYDGAQVAEVLMGMIDPDTRTWEVRPAPTRLVEVVDRLVEGDTIVPMFLTERGTLQAGPEVKVDVIGDGVEALALAEEHPGRRLTDLPRF